MNTDKLRGLPVRPSQRLFVKATLALTAATVTSWLAWAQMPVQPFCTDFDDRNLHSFVLCPGRDQVIIRLSTDQANDPQEGPSGLPSDVYMHLLDDSGPSLVCATGEYVGDWTSLIATGCSALCFDIRIFEDSCVEGIAACDNNGGWLPITPRFTLQGGVAGNLRAAFIGATPITDDEGPMGGWHTLCAPIAFLDTNGNLPSNADGHWEMLSSCDLQGGQVPCPITPPPANASWNDLITRVVGLQLPIDYTANPAERVGYDNICVRDNNCPCDAACGDELTVTCHAAVVDDGDSESDSDSAGQILISYETNGGCGEVLTTAVIQLTQGDDADSDSVCTGGVTCAEVPVSSGDMVSVQCGKCGCSMGGDDSDSDSAEQLPTWSGANATLVVTSTDACGHEAMCVVELCAADDSDSESDSDSHHMAGIVTRGHTR